MHFRKLRSTTGETKVDIQMTPMLDMIFQLLIFFILTFRPVSNEGQLDITMSSVKGRSAAGPSLRNPVEVEDEVESRPVPLVLKSTPDGKLAPNGIVLMNRPLSGGFASLVREMKQIVGSSPDEFEVQLRADTDLHYDYVMQAVNAVSNSGVKLLSFGAPPDSP